MLTKATQKLIRSLDSRKGRRREGLFVAEGPKLVGELLDYFRLRQLFVSTDAAVANAGLMQRIDASRQQILSAGELERISLQQSPQGMIALFEIPNEPVDFATTATRELVLALDDVQDPGNLGTIIRMADWFGVAHIWCTPATADVWNPKVIQATMGGIARTRVHILNDLSGALSDLPPEVPVYATSLRGEIIWQSTLSATGVIVMGNEGRGISPQVDASCRQRLLIPNYPAGQSTTDSLNVAMATAIVLAEFRRRAFGA